MQLAHLFYPIYKPEVFQLRYDDQDKPCVTATQPGLKGTIAAKVGYKIYVLANAAGVQYVGCTRTGMGSRIRMGHMRSQTPKNGYHGYKWLTQPGLQLYVFALPLELLALATASQISHSILAERIEAELVYAVRAATGHWPLSQHEIHFHNLTTQPEAGTLTTSIAEAMYAQLGQPEQLPLVP